MCISCKENEMYSPNFMMSISLLITAVITNTALFYFNFLITSIALYFTVMTIVILGIISLYLYLRSKEDVNYSLLITEDYIFINEPSGGEEINLPLTDIQYFETRFNEIVFHTNQDEVITLKLNRISCETKRWEIKEFLKEHIPQIRRMHNFSLASS